MSGHEDPRFAPYQTGPLRTAVIGSVGIIAGLVALALFAPATVLPTLLAYGLVILVLWWITGGETPWLWPYAHEPVKRSRARLCYSALQLNRTVVRTALGFGVALALCAAAVGAIVFFVFLFDVLSDGCVHFESYVDFFSDTCVRWIRQAADGHAGTSHIP
jgi:hypothetical protein